MQHYLKTVLKLCYSPKTKANKNSVPFDSVDLGDLKSHAFIQRDGAAVPFGDMKGYGALSGFAYIMHCPQKQGTAVSPAAKGGMDHKVIYLTAIAGHRAYKADAIKQQANIRQLIPKLFKTLEHVIRLYAEGITHIVKAGIIHCLIFGEIPFFHRHAGDAGLACP